MALQRFCYGVHFEDARLYWRQCTYRQFFVDGFNEEERIEQVRAFAHKFGQMLKERWRTSTVRFSIKKLPPSKENDNELASLSNEKLWELYNQPDDGYIAHNEGVSALCELIRRGEIKEHPWKERILNPKKHFCLPYIKIEKE